MSGHATETAADRPDPWRAAELYWRELEKLKARAVCIGLYRQRLSRIVRAVEAVKAIASGGGIAGWVVWQDIHFVWAGIIAAAQLLDALKPIFPFARQYEAASELTAVLETLFIHAEHQWELIYSGRLDAVAILDARRQLALELLTAEHKHFPGGIELPEGLVRLSEDKARSYMLAYGGSPDQGVARLLGDRS